MLDVRGPTDSVESDVSGVVMTLVVRHRPVDVRIDGSGADEAVRSDLWHPRWPEVSS